ncbi:MAG TPA: magnesium chelatase [Firmicutes bacterium]|nr:magnesium chelatase [Bacillota bacterium]
MKSFVELRRHAGNAALFHAVELSLVGAVRGVPLHLHAQGVRGTGKTTVLRSAAALLPPISRVAGCLFNCDPREPHCPHHRVAAGGPAGGGEGWPVEEVPAPFRELSHSTKTATAVGSLDLSRLVGRDDPAAALLPGLIPQAHRGILFVDEINRLADTAPELTDLLLDVMGTKPGRVQVEEAGLPVAVLPLTTTVWAASNPDEDPGPLAELRRQLADRFDLVVNVERPGEPEAVAEIVAAAAGVGRRPSPAAGHRQHLASLRASIIRAAELAGQVVLPETLSRTIARLYCSYGVESLRAAEALALAAIYHCALRGGRVAEREDLAAVLPLVWGHRLEPDQLRLAQAELRQGRGRPLAPVVAGAGRLPDL